MKDIIYDASNLINKNFIHPRVLNKYIKKFENARINIDEQIKNNKLGFRKLLYTDVKDIKTFSKNNYKRFEDVVVLGIGGSALGVAALFNSLKPLNYNFLDKKSRKGYPRLFVLDNIDPDFVLPVFEVINLKKTLFIVITKSGTTTETMTQFMIVFNLIKKRLGTKNLKKQIVAITDKEKGILLKIANEFNLTRFYIPSDVGGRFSVLSPVGLLPASLIGINIEKLLEGGRVVDKWLKKKSIMDIPPYLNSVLHYIADVKYKKKISVMMPYSNRLYTFADWYRQLWAESLGKMYNRKGKKVFTGQTPVKALGATDQHSQIQLYNEGPKDKIITLIKVENSYKNIKIPSEFKDILQLSIYHKHTLQDILNIEFTATEKALTKYGVFNCKLIFPEINEYTVGQFIYFYEIQTAFSGELYDINAYDQPGVEEGKKNIKELLKK